MKHFIITILLLMIGFQLYSQNTIGFRSYLLFLKFSTEDIESQESETFVEDIQITRDFDVDLYFVHQMKKMRLIYQLGCRRAIETRELNTIRQGTLDVSTRRRVLIRYRALIGIENEVDLKPLTIFYGLELPLEYEPENRNTFGSNVLDDDNNVVGSFETINYTPDAYRFGLYANLKFYHFFNRIGVGLEFVNGVSFHKPSKSIKGEFRIYDVSGQLIESRIQEKKEKRLVINKTSFIGIGLRYKLNK